MGTIRNMGAATALAAVLAGAVPAGAHDRDWRRHDRGKVSTGTAVGAVALVGLVALLASKKSKPAAYDPAPPPPPPPGGYDVPPPPPPGGYDVPPADGYDAPAGDPREAAAVDACIDYVGQHYADEGQVGRVEQITEVTPRQNGGYKVRGYVRVESWYGRPIQMSKFKCSLNASGSSRTLTTTLARWPG